MARDTEWTSYYPWPWQHVRDADGKRLRGKVMRRRVCDEWQYRPLTETEIAEEIDFQDSKAW